MTTCDTTLQELDDLLSEYDMKRDLVEINRKAPQWAHKAVWNKWYVGGLRPDRLCHSHGAAPGTIAIWQPTIHSPCS